MVVQHVETEQCEFELTTGNLRQEVYFCWVVKLSDFGFVATELST